MQAGPAAERGGLVGGQLLEDTRSSGPCYTHGPSASIPSSPGQHSQLVAMSSSEDEGSLRFIYELLGWVEETQVRPKLQPIN